LWFTNGNNSIGRITTSGVVHDYTGTGIDAPYEITAGPDGALWFTNMGNFSIGRITAVPVITDSPTSGVPGTSVSVSGKGYAPGEQVNVTYKTGLSSPKKVLICTTTAAADGTFSCVGDIPSPAEAGVDGSHNVQSVGQTSGTVAKTPFTLT
jgi:hypothetical protein